MTLNNTPSLPYYRFLEEFDLLLIGVSHGQPAIPGTDEYDRFREEVMKSDLLIMEGTKEANEKLEFMIGLPEFAHFNYEYTALSLFKGDVIYPEEREKISFLLVKHTGYGQTFLSFTLPWGA